MASEQFLINPPKRAPKRSKSGIVRRHRILAIEGKGGVIHTSGGAKIVRPGLRINPFRRNPLFGEELMFIGSNPRKRGETTMFFGKRHHKKSHKRHRKNPVRRHRRGFRHNPVMSGAGMKDLAMLIVGAGGGALAARMIPNALGWSGMKGYAAQGGILLASMLLLSKVSKEMGKAAAMGAAAILVTDVAHNVATGAAAVTTAPATVAGYEELQLGATPRISGKPYENPYEAAY